jgi:hypothetical protein
MSPNVKEVIKLVIVLAICVYVAVLVSGCSTLPDNVGECPEYWPDDVAECESRIIKKEQREFEFEERKRLYGVRGAACWRAGGYYDEFSRTCRGLFGPGGINE